MAQEKTRVSVIGLGNLGSTLAGAILAAGQDVAVWNRTPGKAAELVAAGATESPSLAAALEHAEIVVFALPEYGAVETVFAGAVAEGRLEGRAIVNLTTGDAAQAEAADRLFRGGGAEYLDGGCGSYPAAIGSDDSTCIYSGPRALFDRVSSSVIKPIGRDGAWVAEEIGAANSLYLATTGFFMTSLAGYFESAAHASRHDVGIAAYTDYALKYMDTLRELFVASKPLIEARKHSGIDQAALSAYMDATITLKDDAEGVGARTDLVAVAKQYFQEAIDAGHGPDEVSSLFEVMMAESGQKVA